ncbi:MAG: endonuclease [Acidobacteria bacterium]|nr:MAG: endonuclease [Acidobacteriota bacterium]
MAEWKYTAKIKRLRITSEKDWLRWRQKEITASVIGAIWGLHPYETIYGLHAKVSGMKLPAGRDNTVMARGRELQELTGRYVARAHPRWKIRACDYYLRDTKRRFGGTPDFFVRTDTGRKGLVEAKTVATAQFRQHWAHGVPPWIALQTLTCAMLARAEFAIVAALEIKSWGPPELHEFVVPRHPAAEQRILEGVAAFWSDIDAGRIPNPDYSRDRGLIMASLPAAIKGKTVDLSSDNRMPELLRERAKLKQQIDEAQEALDAIETEAKDKIGDAEIAIVNGWRVTLKEISKKEHVVKATTYRQLRAIRDEIERADDAAA